jgi:UPF0042 nucleotide-binding protein
MTSRSASSAARKTKAAFAKPTSPAQAPTKARAALAGGSARVVFVTGMSGAGRSSALKALEDIGYEAVDNLPLSLIAGLLAPKGLAGMSKKAARSAPPLAIGVDIRTRDFGVASLLETLDALMAQSDLDAHLLFLDASDDVLLRRYTETRRRHPLAVDRPVRDGIAHERRMLAKLRLRADRLIDTSDFAPGDLRRLVEGLYGLNKRGQLAVCVTSFSYRLGVPREADLVFDARFLRNPHYVPALKPHTGLDKDVGAYVAADGGFDEFFDSLTHLLTLLLPRFAQEGKSYLTIAIGCTGGRHRSVYVAETLAHWLRRQRFDASSDVLTVHRDIQGGGSGAESPTRKTKPPRAPQARRGAAQTTRAGKANSGKTRGR